MSWHDEICSILAYFERFRKIDAGISVGTREQILQDEAMAQQLLPECLEWAKSKQNYRPSRADIRTFLVVKNTYLCEAAMRSLWQQAKAKLREMRRESFQLASQDWRENSSNIGLAWSKDEDDALLGGFDAGQKSIELARTHRRTIRAIELRLEKFGKIKLPLEMVSKR